MFFAHSADPTNLSVAELFGDWVLALVTLALTGGLSWVALAPLFKQLAPPAQNEDPSVSVPASSENPARERARAELAGWVALGLGALLAMGSWVTRQSIEAALTAPPPTGMHMAHSPQNGGQIAMWGDYHAELARMISGEYRLWLSDGNEAPIGAAFFSGQVVPRDARTGALDTAAAAKLETSLDGLSRQCQLPQAVRSVQVQMTYPAGTIRLNFIFDEGPRRRSLMRWCGPPRPR
jgi:hypothetical protein